MQSGTIRISDTRFRSLITEALRFHRELCRRFSTVRIFLSQGGNSRGPLRAASPLPSAIYPPSFALRRIFGSRPAPGTRKSHEKTRKHAAVRDLANLRRKESDSVVRLKSGEAPKSGEAESFPLVKKVTRSTAFPIATKRSFVS